MAKSLHYIDEQHPYLSFTPSIHAAALDARTDSIPARTYIDYAIADLTEETDRGTINAFGNAKRALHLIVDNTLHAYGLFAHNRSCNFPTKLQLLDSAGLLPISVLHALNVERNIMEHEYNVPERDRAREAVDIAHLLSLASAQLVRFVIMECVSTTKLTGHPHVLIRLYPRRGHLAFHDLEIDPSLLSESDGAQHFIGRLRQHGEVRPGVVVAPAPFKTIELRRNNVDDWKIIIQSFLSLESSISGGLSAVRRDTGGAQITLPVTVEIDKEEADEYAAIFGGFGGAVQTPGDIAEQMMTGTTGLPEPCP